MCKLKTKREQIEYRHPVSVKCKQNDAAQGDCDVTSGAQIYDDVKRSVLEEDCQNAADVFSSVIQIY